jgi:hypothetical protein
MPAFSFDHDPRLSCSGTSERDIKDVIGILMRVLGGGEVLPSELEDLVFEADGEIEAALSAAFIRLQEFAYDRDLRRNDPALDRARIAPSGPR